MLHYGAAAALLLRGVGVLSLVDLQRRQRIYLDVDGAVGVDAKLTVPQRLGTMKSFGSLSVKAIRLWHVSQHTIQCTAPQAISVEVIDVHVLHRSLRHRYPPPI